MAQNSIYVSEIFNFDRLPHQNTLIIIYHLSFWTIFWWTTVDGCTVLLAKNWIIAQPMAKAIYIYKDLSAMNESLWHTIYRTRLHHKRKILGPPAKSRKSAVVGVTRYKMWGSRRYFWHLIAESCTVKWTEGDTNFSFFCCFIHMDHSCHVVLSLHQFTRSEPKQTPISAFFVCS